MSPDYPNTPVNIWHRPQLSPEYPGKGSQEILNFKSCEIYHLSCFDHIQTGHLGGDILWPLLCIRLPTWSSILEAWYLTWRRRHTSYQRDHLGNDNITILRKNGSYNSPRTNNEWDYVIVLFAMFCGWWQRGKPSNRDLDKKFFAIYLPTTPSGVVGR